MLVENYVCNLLRDYFSTEKVTCQVIFCIFYQKGLEKKSAICYNDFVEKLHLRLLFLLITRRLSEKEE